MREFITDNCLLLFCAGVTFALLAFFCRSFVSHFYVGKLIEAQKRLADADRFDYSVIGEAFRVPFSVSLAGYVSLLSGIVSIVCLVMAAVGGLLP